MKVSHSPAPGPQGMAKRRTAHMDDLKSQIQVFVDAVNKGDAKGVNSFRSFVNIVNSRLLADSSWPDENTVKRSMGVVFHHSMALYLYKQIYYQHYFEVNQRWNDPEMYVLAVSNMSDLFCVFSSHDFKLDISVTWLWSIIEEFISNFEAVGSFKDHPKFHELSIDRVCNPHMLLNTFHVLIERSRMLEMMKPKMSGETITVARDVSSTHRVLGFYSIIGLIRFHTSDGDYGQAMQYADLLPQNIAKQRILSGKAIAPVLTANFCAGFCYFMSRRYTDAIRVLTESLQFIGEIRELESKQFRNKTTLLYQKKMYHLLALVLAFFPIQIEDRLKEEISAVLAEKNDSMKNGERDAFLEVFIKSCPYFYSQTEDVQKTKEIQAFMMEVDEQLPFFKLRNILSHYSTISLERLASLMNKSESDTIAFLMSWKHKQGLPHGKLKPAEVNRSQSNIDFYIDNNVVYISHVRPPDKFGCMFLNQMCMLRKLQADRLKRIKGVIQL